MVTHVKVEGFKSLASVDVALGPLNVLIGANGSGKSNFLAFFDFLLAVNRGGLAFEVAKGGGVNGFLHFGRQRTSSLSWDVEFGGDNSRYTATLAPASGETFVFEREVASLRGAGRAQGVGHTESKLRAPATAGQHVTDAIARELDRIAVYHFHDTGVNSPFHQPSSAELRHARLRKHGDNLSGFLYQLRRLSPKRYRVLTRAITSIAPYFADFDWETLGNGKVSLVWRSRYGDEVFRFPDFSDGTQRFIALCCVFLQDDLPGTIVIDEPELGLHPTAVAKLVGLMRSAVGRDAQVIAATQSTGLIDYFTPEEVVTTDQVKGATTFGRLDGDALASWLDQYSLGDLWGQHIIEAAQVEAPND